MKGILLKILDWLRVLIKNRDTLKAAWDLIHPLLKEYLKDEWLNIIDSAINGLTEKAMRALDAVEETIKRVCNSNMEWTVFIIIIPNNAHRRAIWREITNLAM